VLCPGSCTRAHQRPIFDEDAMKTDETGLTPELPQGIFIER
jgi:hypothetical protein